jgi:hypothetical protein
MRFRYAWTDLPLFVLALLLLIPLLFHLVEIVVDFIVSSEH